MAPMRFKQVQRFNLAKKIFWVRGTLRIKQSTVALLIKETTSQTKSQQINSNFGLW